MFGRPRTAHLSVDDTIWLFKDLNEEEYTSAFEQPILGFFRTLHQKYGIAISFYCFEEQDWMRLSAVTDRYQQELAESSGWLRFGFHARNENVRYGEIALQQAAADYAEVTAQLRRIVGRTLDERPRIHCYSASRPVLNAMHEEGLQGVLCSETDGDCYGLTPEEKMNIRTKGSFMDKQSRLVYLATDLRIEETNSILKKLIEQQQRKHIEIFTHEWALNQKYAQEKIEIYSSLLSRLGYQGGFWGER